MRLLRQPQVRCRVVSAVWAAFRKQTKVFFGVSITAKTGTYENPSEKLGNRRSILLSYGRKCRQFRGSYPQPQNQISITTTISVSPQTCAPTVNPDRLYPLREGGTVKQVCNHYLTFRAQKRDTGDRRSAVLCQEHVRAKLFLECRQGFGHHISRR